MEQGTDLEYLKQLLAYWADEFDWRAQERELNAVAQFRAELDGVQIHFVHERARHGHGIPLILTHGWPSTFARAASARAIPDRSRGPRHRRSRL